MVGHLLAFILFWEILLLYFTLIVQKSYLKWARLVQRTSRDGNFVEIAMYHARICENEEMSATRGTTSSSDIANDAAVIPPVAPSASARKIEFPVPQRAKNTETEAKDWLYYQLFSKCCPVKNASSLIWN